MFTSSLPKTILRLLVVLGLLVFGIWSYHNYQTAQQQLDSLSEQLQTEEVPQQGRQELLDQVSQLMALPEGNPLIFDIQNAEAVAAAQPFFEGAIDGDKAIIYPQAGKTIIYSPSRNIIVNSGDLLVGTDGELEATKAADSEAQ